MHESLLRFNKKQRYVVFDTETEGLNLVTSRPWQVAWLVIEGDTIIDKKINATQHCVGKVFP